MELQEIRKELGPYLINKGINIHKNFKCLACGGGDHTPPMSYNNTEHYVKCFSCGFKGDIFDLVGAEYNILDFKEKLNKTKDILNIIDYDSKPKQEAKQNTLNQKSDKGVETINIKEYTSNCFKAVNQTNYFKNRGISETTINKFNLGYDTQKQAVVIPISEDYYTSRSTLDKKHYKPKGLKQKFFNFQYLNQDIKEPIFIVEGEFDALSIEEVGNKAIALLGVQNQNLLIDELKRTGKKPNLIISFDNDDDPETIQKVNESKEKLKNGLNDLKVNYIISNISSSSKDPNEALIKNKSEFITAVKVAEKEVIENIDIQKQLEKEAYAKESAAYSLKDFKAGINASVDTPPISTGFKCLDVLLEGGLYEGLYILGAISSLGKTTFVLQIADQIAQQGEDVLIFSLEMARSELISKSISRLTLLNADDRKTAKTNRGITTGKRYLDYSKQEIELINKSIADYESYGKNIYIKEGLGNIGVNQIKETVTRHISITGKKPIVIIDYLQILAPFDMRATDKQNTDKSVMELKRMTRDFKIPLIAISSFNRENYNMPVSMAAFKESGAIEYSSDVLIGLQYLGQGKDFNIDEAAEKDPREIELKILKNRNGRKGKTGFNYFPLFNYYKEVVFDYSQVVEVKRGGSNKPKGVR